MSGILKGDGAYPLAVGGWKDHVHVFFELPMALSVAEVMKRLKGGSSEWINENKLVKGKFQWQSGYGAFSYSRSQRNKVIQYVMKQEEHHAVKSFREEYLSMLKGFEIPYEEKYLFEFYD
jgi:hypothetical protein